MASKKAAAIRAAGGVLWRVQDGALQIALVHRPRYDDWSLPKGKLEPGEDELTAAVREIDEETGSMVSVSRQLRSISYQVSGQDKTVAYWAAQHIGGAFKANDEVDVLAWLAVDDARARLSHPDEAGVLDEFTATPLPESVVVLVRHAKAGKRSEWKGDDRMRTLDRSGRKQARHLSAFLQPFRPDRAVSARPVRCSQTLTPVAESLGLTIETDAAFDDESYEANPEISAASLIGLAVPRHVTVVASQGSAIPGLIAGLAPHLHSTRTRKGAAWVLSFADGVLLSADYYDRAAR